MSSTTVASDDCVTEQANESWCDVQRNPFYFPCGEETIFGWLHTSEANHPSPSMGIVICPPTGSEYMRSYRTIRHIADALARNGHTVLRIDYQGTGNSSGHENDPNRLEQYCNSIKAALDLLKNDFQCQQLALMGMRVGANLAAIVSSEYPIASLAMWAPIKKINQYAREMQALSLVGREKNPPVPNSKGDLEVAGYLLQKQFVEDLKQFDLTSLPLHIKHLLLIERDDLPTNNKLHQQLEAQGVSVTSIVGEGYQSMMTEPHHCVVPLSAIQQLSEWQQQISGSIVSKNTDMEAQRIDTIVEDLKARHCISSSFNRGNGFEEAVVIPSTRPLFGVLLTPAQTNTSSLAESRPIVLLPNGGAVHQVGPNNLYLDLSQQLVNAGFRCFRFDLSGLGDSIISNVKQENTTYTPYALEDLAIVIEFLKRKCKGSNFIVMGLCSGAYVSYQASFRLPYSELKESVLISPLTFYWEEGRILSSPSTIEHKEFNYYKSALKDFSKWRNFLTGKSKLNLISAIQMILGRIRKKIELLQRQKKISQSASKTTDKPISLYGFGESADENLPYDLQNAIDAGKKVSFFFARTDPGFTILKFQAAKKIKQLLKKRAITIEFIDQADHTFTAFDSRLILINKVSDYLSKNY